MTTSTARPHSDPRFPVAAFLLTLIGNIAVIAIVAATTLAVLVSAVVIFAGQLIGLG